MENALNRKIRNSIKWSSITEVFAKVIIPINNMILARLLTPEAFGIIATVNMVVSFVDLFTDAGFQKYLVQHEFTDEQDRNETANVAFLTNLILSLLIMGAIIMLRNEIATLVGAPNLGVALAFASLQIPMTSFSSIQMALYKRDFDFKTLFYQRIIVALSPLIVSVPLAIIGFGYWSLIIGNVFAQAANAIVLTIKSKWKPNLFYSFIILKEMFSFSFMTLLESFMIWLSTWVDMFILGKYLSAYYLGLYRTSLQIVNSLITIITSATIPVLFSTLSRLQNNKKQYEEYFFNFQRLASFLIFPLGIGTLIYKDVVTNILLGNKWIEASELIGLWCLSKTLSATTSNYCSEVYRSKGRPDISFIVQLLYLFILIPLCIYGVKQSFMKLVYLKAFSAIPFLIIHLIAIKLVMKMSVTKMLINLIKPIACTISMGILGVCLHSISANIIWEFFSIFLCILIYIIVFYFIAHNDAVFVFNTCLINIKKRKKQ